MFQSLLSSLAAALGVTRRSPLSTIVIDVQRVVPKLSNIEVRVAEALLPSSYLPYMTSFVPVLIHGYSSTIARLNKKRYLTATAATATVVVKEEDVLDS